MATATARVETTALSTIHYLAVVLVVITGLVHLILGVRFISQPLGPPFVLAGLGFFGALALFLLEYRRRLLYAVGIPFTAIQFVLYFVFNWNALTTQGLGANALGLGDKVVQLALIVVLVQLYRQESVAD